MFGNFGITRYLGFKPMLQTINHNTIAKFGELLCTSTVRLGIVKLEHH